MDLNTVYQKALPYMYKIETQDGYGTGFIYYIIQRNDQQFLVYIATAAHVIAKAKEWYQPIRLRHYSSTESKLLYPNMYTIFLSPFSDSAIIQIDGNNVPFAYHEPLPDLPSLSEYNSIVPIGKNVTWMGFPNIEPECVCLFSGLVSAHKKVNNFTTYIIDGVSIHGVSGGPVMYISEHNRVEIIGVVSSYSPNRAFGQTLPGLMYACDVSYFNLVNNALASQEAAATEEPPTTEPPTTEPLYDTDGEIK